MRHAILIIMFIAPFLSKEQIIEPPSSPPKTTLIGSVNRDEKLIAEFYFYFERPSRQPQIRPSKPDTTFALRFRNYKYPDKNIYSTVEFGANGGKKDSIYYAFKSVFKNETKDNSSYSTTFTLNYGDIIQIKPYKKDNSYYSELDFKESYIQMTEAEVDQLFHKSK